MVIFLSSYLKHLDSENETDSSDSEDETKDKKLGEGEEKVKALSLSCYLNRYVGKVCKAFSYIQDSSWPIFCAFCNEMSDKHSSLGIRTATIPTPLPINKLKPVKTFIITFEFINCFMQSMYVGPPFIIFCRAACRLKLGDYSGAAADCNEVQLLNCNKTAVMATKLMYSYNLELHM